MKQYTTALIIGRFQPFHNGHLYLLRKTLPLADQVIIGIGSTKSPNDENPFSFQECKTMLESVIKNERLSSQITKVIELPDYPSDADWLKEVKRRVGSFSVVVGNNEWTNGIFEKDGYPIIRVPFWRRYMLEGTRIRALMKKRQQWENRVPEYLVHSIKEYAKNKKALQETDKNGSPSMF